MISKCNEVKFFGKVCWPHENGYYVADFDGDYPNVLAKLNACVKERELMVTQGNSKRYFTVVKIDDLCFHLIERDAPKEPPGKKSATLKRQQARHKKTEDTIHGVKYQDLGDGRLLVDLFERKTSNEKIVYVTLYNACKADGVARFNEGVFSVELVQENGCFILIKQNEEEAKAFIEAKESIDKSKDVKDHDYKTLLLKNVCVAGVWGRFTWLNGCRAIKGTSGGYTVLKNDFTDELIVEAGQNSSEMGEESMMQSLGEEYDDYGFPVVQLNGVLYDVREDEKQYTFVPHKLQRFMICIDGVSLQFKLCKRVDGWFIKAVITEEKLILSKIALNTRRQLFTNFEEQEFLSKPTVNGCFVIEYFLVEKNS